MKEDDILNGFILLVPFILIRFGLLSILNKEALKQAAFFAPLVGGEKTAYYFYQLASIFFFIYPCFLKITADGYLSSVSFAVYVLGAVLCFASVLSFAKPEESGINLKGVYKFSRNPMYVAYFVYFLGCVLLTRSFLLLAILFVFQISGHWIILSEERWCINRFGQEYKNYMQKVRRYI